VRDLPPWETLPDGEADRDSGIEVTTRSWGAGDDGEGDTDYTLSVRKEQLVGSTRTCEAPADLEEGAKCCYAQWAGSIDGETRNGCNSWESVEVDCQLFIVARNKTPDRAFKEKER
jgi:hypothetical protein